MGYSHAFVSTLKTPTLSMKTPPTSTAQQQQQQQRLQTMTSLAATTWSWTTSTALVIAQQDTATTTAAFEDAFQDQVNLWDGPVPIMLGIFGVVVVVLAGLSFLSSKVDDAIYQTLQDFESTLRQYFPQKWQFVESQLPPIRGEERDIKLLQIMEEMQEKEPDFMMQVRQKMDF